MEAKSSSDGVTQTSKSKDGGPQPHDDPILPSLDVPGYLFTKHSNKNQLATDKVASLPGAATTSSSAPTTSSSAPATSSSAPDEHPNKTSFPVLPFPSLPQLTPFESEWSTNPNHPISLEEIYAKATIHPGMSWFERDAEINTTRNRILLERIGLSNPIYTPVLPGKRVRAPGDDEPRSPRLKSRRIAEQSDNSLNYNVPLNFDGPMDSDILESYNPPEVVDNPNESYNSLHPDHPTDSDTPSDSASSTWYPETLAIIDRTREETYGEDPIPQDSDDPASWRSGLYPPLTLYENTTQYTEASQHPEKRNVEGEGSSLPVQRYIH